MLLEIEGILKSQPHAQAAPCRGSNVNQNIGKEILPDFLPSLQEHLVFFFFFF